MTRRLVLAGETVRPVATVDLYDVRATMSGTCWRKHRHDQRHDARVAAESVAKRCGDEIVAYLCPFSSLYGRHFHVGHPPAHEAVVKLAQVMRWCNAHPDEVPAPPTMTA